MTQRKKTHASKSPDRWVTVRSFDELNALLAQREAEAPSAPNSAEIALAPPAAFTDESPHPEVIPIQSEATLMESTAPTPPAANDEDLSGADTTPPEAVTPPEEETVAEIVLPQKEPVQTVSAEADETPAPAPVKHRSFVTGEVTAITEKGYDILLENGLPAFAPKVSVRLTDDVESLAVGVTAEFLVIHDGAHGHAIELAYNTPKANRLKQEFSLEQKIRTGEPTLVLVKKAKRILGKDLLGLDCVFGTRPVYVPHYHLDARLNPEALEGTLIAVVLKPQRATPDGKPKYTSIKASQTEAAEKLNKAAFNKLRIGATTTGTITASTPIGYTLELVTKVLVDGYAFTLEAVLPREEAVVEEIQIGDSVAVKVTNIDWSSRAILVSQKRFVSELRKEMQAQSFGELQLNKTYNAKVVEIIASGAKVVLANGFVALVPNGEGNVGEMKVDDELTGLLLFKLDEVKQRAYLSQKRVFVGEVLQGTIQQIVPKDGVRLTLKGNVTALLPAEALTNPEQVLHSGYQLNQKPWVEVVSIDGGVVIVKRAGQHAVKRAKGKSTKRVKKQPAEAAA